MPTSKTRKRRRAARPRSPAVTPAPELSEASPERASGKPGSSSRRAKTAPAEPWSRRSVGVMCLIVGLFQLPFGTLHFLTDRSSDLFEDVILVPSGSPPLLLAACFVAMPLARRLTRERRPLGILETMGVGATIFLLFLSFAFTVVGVAGEGSSSNSTASPKPLPTPVGSLAVPTPAPPAASPAPPPVSPAPRATKPVAPSPARTARLNAGQISGLALANLVALGATAYIFPMLQRLFRRRGGTRRERGSSERGAKGRRP